MNIINADDYEWKKVSNYYILYHKINGDCICDIMEINCDCYDCHFYSIYTKYNDLVPKTFTSIKQAQKIIDTIIGKYSSLRAFI